MPSPPPPDTPSPPPLGSPRSVRARATLLPAASSSRASQAAAAAARGCHADPCDADNSDGHSVYRFDIDDLKYPSAGTQAFPAWWPLAIFKRRAARRDSLSLLPQSVPLLRDTSRSDDDEKLHSPLRAVWGRRVGSKFRPHVRRGWSTLVSVWNAQELGMILAAIITLALLAFGVNTRLVRPPPYNLVPRQEYATVLSNFVHEHNLTAFVPPSSDTGAGSGAWTDTIAEQLLTLQDRMYARALEARCAGTKQTSLISLPLPANVPPSHIPSTMYSSDKAAPPANESAAWRKGWADRGFDPVIFLEDDQADAFVDQDFGPVHVKSVHSPSTATSPAAQRQTLFQKAWKALPRGVLRADFMRYLLLLSRGGTWADIDVQPIGNLSSWTTPDAHWVPVPRVSEHPAADDPSCASLRTGPEQKRIYPTEPVRLVVGLECEPWQYMQHSSRAWFESARILAMPRHREVQFTQWTLHGAPGHPVLVDVLRRLLDTDKVYDEYRQAYAPFRRDDVHPWTNIDAARKWVFFDSTPAYHGSTDEEDPNWHGWRIWPWQWAWPRWGWHPLSVEEWTGPALWTDAVFTYLNAVAGLHPRDLYGLTQPVQIADVIVAPNAWFAPPRDDLAQAKVLHNFRGSWKRGADVLSDNGTDHHS